MPFQNQEVLLTLRHFFKGNDSIKDRLPTGEYGTQIPQPMIALVSIAVCTVPADFYVVTEAVMAG